MASSLVRKTILLLRLRVLTYCSVGIRCTTASGSFPIGVMIPAASFWILLWGPRAGAVSHALTRNRRDLSSNRFDRGWFNQTGIRQTQQFPSNFRLQSGSDFLLLSAAPPPNRSDAHQETPFVSLDLMLHHDYRSARKAGVTPAPTRYSTSTPD